MTVPPRLRNEPSHEDAANRLRSLAGTSPSGIAGGVSIRSSKASTQNRSPASSMSTMRPAARRAATIFQPPIDPERSSTTTTSRGALDGSAGGTRVSDQVPSSASVASAPAASATSSADDDSRPWSRRKRSTKSRSARAPDSTRSRARPSAAGASTAVGSEARRSETGRPAPSTDREICRSGRSSASVSSGGVTRDASGTASVSRATPEPVWSPPTGWPVV